MPRDRWETMATQPCYYCGKIDVRDKLRPNAKNRKYIKITQQEIQSFTVRVNGIDRVDSDKGYELDNCVPCCTMCNWMKMNYTKEEFLDQIRDIYERMCISKRETT